MWKKNSLRFHFLCFFFLFSILILGFLWGFQVLFLKQFYQHEKEKSIQKVGNFILKNQMKDNFVSLLDGVSIENEVCITITDSNHYLYESIFFEKGCLMDGNLKSSYIEQFIHSGLEENTNSFQNDQYENQTLVYALKLNDSQYAFIHTPLEPIDQTAAVLKKQLVVVMILVFVLSFLLSLWISKYLARPIHQLNEQSKRLASGDLESPFDDQSSILELNEFSNTLNFARLELQKTDDLRRELMSNVSHDLKTPLTMIKAYAEMSQDLHAKDPIKQKEDMDIIVSETDRLSNLVNDILDLSKMESHIDELEMEKFHLYELIQEILKRYSFYEELNQYEFSFQSNKKRIYVVADKRKMEQVLYNLINNAITYTGEDHKVEIHLQVEKEDVLVQIKDTGKGIPKEEIPYIWNHYYKSQKNHQRNLVGTGLGLSIVKSILEKHQFPYGVDSVVGEGSTFYFRMPLSSKKEE